LAGASFSSARLIVTARFIVVRSGTSEYSFSSVGMVTKEPMRSSYGQAGQVGASSAYTDI
jgi:hypothetical protein